MLDPRCAAVALAVCSALTAQGKNLLFYGNSFSTFNGGVVPVVRALAIAAGEPTPFCQAQLVTGTALHFHATDPTQVAAITTSLAAGQQWDAVVMQGISHETTTTLGNPAQFTADAITILGNVRNHSPAATGLIFQTFARGQGHAWYPGTFPSPLVMHTQVRTTCKNAALALQSVFGPGAAANCAIGDCAALREFVPAIYFGDLQHPAPELTILSGMCLFTSLYGQRVSDLTPTLSTQNPLGAILLNFGFGQADWRRMAGIADRCAPRAVRRFPGSGDQLLLESSTLPAAPTASPRTPVVAGATVVARLSSRNGVFTTAPALLVASPFATGQPPIPWLLPELAVDAVAAFALAASGDLSQPLVLTAPVPWALPGLSLVVQGIALAPSSETGNPLLTTTDGHELVFQ